MIWAMKKIEQLFFIITENIISLFLLGMKKMEISTEFEFFLKNYKKHSYQKQRPAMIYIEEETVLNTG